MAPLVRDFAIGLASSRDTAAANFASAHPSLWASREAAIAHAGKLQTDTSAAATYDLAVTKAGAAYTLAADSAQAVAALQAGLAGADETLMNSRALASYNAAIQRLDNDSIGAKNGSYLPTLPQTIGLGTLLKPENVPYTSLTVAGKPSSNGGEYFVGLAGGMYYTRSAIAEIPRTESLTSPPEAPSEATTSWVIYLGWEAANGVVGFIDVYSFGITRSIRHSVGGYVGDLGIDETSWGYNTGVGIGAYAAFSTGNLWGGFYGLSVLATSLGQWEMENGDGGLLSYDAAHWWRAAGGIGQAVTGVSGSVTFLSLFGDIGQKVFLAGATILAAKGGYELYNADKSNWQFVDYVENGGPLVVGIVTAGASSLRGAAFVRTTFRLPTSASLDLAETGALGGSLFPTEKIPLLAGYLDRRGVWLAEGINGSFDGARRVMTLPRNPTVLQVRHELSHFLDFKKYGNNYYQVFNSFEREEMVLDRLMNNRVWSTLSDAEREWSSLYPFTRHNKGY